MLSSLDIVHAFWYWNKDFIHFYLLLSRFSSMLDPHVFWNLVDWQLRVTRKTL